MASARFLDRRFPVLNAFRHHGVGTTMQPSSDPQSLNVLNAFRHHRSRITDASPTATGDRRRCSTPFGIIGVRTRRSCARCADGSAVLNAFRHH